MLAKWLYPIIYVKRITLQPCVLSGRECEMWKNTNMALTRIPVPSFQKCKLLCPVCTYALIFFCFLQHGEHFWKTSCSVKMVFWCGQEAKTHKNYGFENIYLYLCMCAVLYIVTYKTNFNLFRKHSWILAHWGFSGNADLDFSGFLFWFVLNEKMELEC